MNRSNVGNIVTNGMQILSVGATTGAHLLGRAERTLNNEPQATKTNSKNTSNEEVNYYQRDINGPTLKDNNQNEDIQFVDFTSYPFRDVSPQFPYVERKTLKDNTYLTNRRLLTGGNN